MSATDSEPLAGRCIAIAEGRELDVFAGLLTRRGARVLRYPLVRIVDAADPAPVLAWAAQLAQSRFDDLILLTGEGLRRICSCIETHRPSLRAPFLQGLSAVRKITRGPKPARALRELGMSADLPATEPTSAGIIATLRAEPLQGRHVGLQLYGEDPAEALVQFLHDAGVAQLHTVAPYRYLDAVSDAAVGELLAQMLNGEVDAIAFTSKAQVERLFRAAPETEVRRALSASAVAAVGPIVAAALEAHGVVVGTMPETAWFLKPLTAALIRTYGSESPGTDPSSAC
jgi:uroporphyrinogen-III synthase